jgi:hypothetical protein
MRPGYGQEVSGFLDREWSDLSPGRDAELDQARDVALDQFFLGGVYRAKTRRVAVIRGFAGRFRLLAGTR